MKALFQAPIMITPGLFHSTQRRSAAPRRHSRPLLVSLIAYISLVAVSVAAAIALVGEDLPMEVLVKVI